MQVYPPLAKSEFSNQMNSSVSASNSAEANRNRVVSIKFSQIEFNFSKDEL